MNNIQHQRLVKEAVRGKFEDNTVVKSRVKPKYPNSAEREFRRIMNAYMKMVKDTLKEHLPAIMESYKTHRLDGNRYDDEIDFGGEVNSEFHKIYSELEQKIQEFGIENFIEKIGSLTKSTSIKEWKRVVSKTLGIDIFEDYYKGDFYATQLRKWVDDNVMQIKSIPNLAVTDMKKVIVESYSAGKPIREVQREIQNQFGISRHKAEMLARDQISTLCSQISQYQQKDAGIQTYTWSSSRDSRVRDCHRELDGQTFSWDNPPEMWYMTKSRGKVYTGKKCHPGEDYCCRCIAIPNFDFDNLNVPIKGK